jgi:hypothetical protein
MRESSWEGEEVQHQRVVAGAVVAAERCWFDDDCGSRLGVGRSQVAAEGDSGYSLLLLDDYH